MKFLSIDIETTSIKPKNGELLSFACVLEDTNDIKSVEDLPHFYCVFKQPSFKGDVHALNMNKELINEITEGTSKHLIEISDFNQMFNNFLASNTKTYHTSNSCVIINEKIRGNRFYPTLPTDVAKAVKIKVCGKNFASFDKVWIENKIPNFNKYFQFHHRMMDVGSMFVDLKNDQWIPDLKECMVRSGIEGEVSHNALQDARDVIRVLRTKY